MKRAYRLTESELRLMIESAVSSIMNESPSLDTGFAAYNKAFDKATDLCTKYGKNDPRTRRAIDQYGNIKSHYDKQKEDEIGTGPGSERRAINREVRNGQIRRGELGYVKGKGWRRTDTNNESIDRIIRESLKRTLNEIGDTKRGQYMLGRALRRASDKGDYDTADNAFSRINPNNMRPAKQGFDDQRDGKNPHQVKWNYDVYKMEDMDNLGRNFIDFIEKSNGGALMQTVVDYETGNQTGQKESPLKELIPQFEEEVLGYECTPDMIDAITKAYNQWWYYAEGTLVDPEE